MKRIEISVRNRVAWQTNKTDYVCGNKGFRVGFDFDSEWDEIETKTARFEYNGTHQDIVFTGSECEVPKIFNTKRMEIGVYAGDLYTTTPAVVGCKRSILCKGSLPADPAPEVYAQIMELLNNIDGVDPEAVEKAVNEYMANHPAEESDPTVPDWAKQPTKPEYTAAEVGAQIEDCVINMTATEGNDLTPDKTWAEVTAAWKSGARLVCMYDGREYALDAFYEGEEAHFVHNSIIGLEEKRIYLLTDSTAYWGKNTPFFGAFPVQSVNGKTGAVVLDAAAVGALPANTEIPTVPTKVSAFENDAGYLTEVPEGYAKSSEIPTDDHINQLINTALGEIENASY